jgi:hypothetical protein
MGTTTGAAANEAAARFLRSELAALRVAATDRLEATKRGRRRSEQILAIQQP